MSLTTNESYCTVAFADTWHSNRGNATWAALTTAQKEQCLRKATDYLEQAYTWTGYRVASTQPLSFPRHGIWIDGYTIPSDSVPVAIQNACAELAVKASQSELSADLTKNVIREKVDVIEVEYSEHSPQWTRYRAIDNMLRGYTLNNGVSRGLIRA